MLKVCFVLSDFPVLSETFVTNQIKGLQERGFDVSVVRDSAPDNSSTIDLQAEPFRSVLPNTRPRWVGDRWIHPLSKRLPKGPLRSSTRAIADIVSDMRLNQYDVLIAHFGHNGKRLARSKFLRTLRRPILTFFHGYDLAIPFHAKAMGKYRRLINYGEMMLPVSHYFRDILVDAGAAPDKVRVHHMGVHTAAIAFEPRTLRGHLRFVSVARLVEKKGTEFAIRALAQLKSRRPDIAWSYDIFGGGPLCERLYTLVNDLGLGSQIRFRGPAAHDDVLLRMREADVLLHPSVTASNGDMEGIPVVLMEAMASGLPVVSTEHAGIPELVKAGETGLLAPERDAEALCHQLEILADHPEACQAMTHNGRELVERNFDQARLDDDLAKIIERMVAQDPSTGTPSPRLRH